MLGRWRAAQAFGPNAQVDYPPLPSAGCDEITACCSIFIDKKKTKGPKSPKSREQCTSPNGKVHQVSKFDIQMKVFFGGRCLRFRFFPDNFDDFSNQPEKIGRSAPVAEHRRCWTSAPPFERSLYLDPVK